MNNWLDKVHNNLDELQTLAAELAELSNVFYLTGNTVMGDNLLAMSKDLYKGQESIYKAIGQMLSDEVKK